MFRKKNTLLKRYLKVLVYLLLINILIVFSTISIHELGHFFIGSFQKCENIKIVLLDANNLNTHTEMNCHPNTNINIIAYGSLLSVTPISFMFLFFEKRTERYYGVLMFGLNLIIATSDIQNIFKSNILYYLQFTIGLCIVIWTQISIVNDILTEDRGI